MADVKICDRCCSAIKPNTAQSFGFGAWRYSIFNRDVSQMVSYDYDLCKQCGAKLTRFLNGEDLAEFEEVSNGT